MHSKQFNNEVELKMEVSIFFENKNNQFYKNVNYKLPSRWKRIVQWVDILIKFFLNFKRWNLLGYLLFCFDIKLNI